MRMTFRLLACLALAWHLAAAGTELVRFPRPEFEGDRRFDYALQLLQLALSKTGVDYRVELAPVAMNQDRQVEEVESGRLIDVAPLPTSPEREQRLLPVRIPINKGVLGWRIGLVRKGDTARFADVRSLDDLMKVRIAQGQGWPDTDILKADGLAIITAPKYEGLFRMLELKRFDYFPRSIMEIWDEEAAHADALEIEPHIALHYVYDAYYMVNRRNTRLAHDISRGLETAISDGSFEALFQKYYGERLRKAHLENRVVIELRNPLLTPETPLNRPELWYDFRRRN